MEHENGNHHHENGNSLHHTTTLANFGDVLAHAMPLLHFLPNQQIDYANDEFSSLFDVPKTSLEGKKYSSLLDEEIGSSESFGIIMKKLSDGKTGSGIFKHFIKSEGKHVWLNCTYSNTYNELKEHTGTLLVAIDVTNFKRQEQQFDQTNEEMKAQEEELRQNMEELATTQEATLKEIEKGKQLQIELDARMQALNATSILSESDQFGTITYVNDKFCEISKWSREECVGKPHNILRHPDNPKSFYKDMWDLLKAGKMFNGRFPNKAKDGSDYWVDSTIVPIIGEDGKPFKYIGIRQDITEQVYKENEMNGLLSAIDMSFASIQFDKNGTVLEANENFLKTLGYRLDEIKGKHHRMFCDGVYANSNDYKYFWQELANGKAQIGEMKRITSRGEEVWLQAAYTPIKDNKGNVIKVLKIATDITAQKKKNADNEGQLEAIRKSNAVIEFNLDGTIIDANDLFLNTLGYRLDEIKGKHHSMFCETSFTASHEYKDFWAKLNRGEFLIDTFKRIGKGGKEVYIQASYNPIFDYNGKPMKVVKFATDVTEFTVGFNAATTFINDVAKGNFESQMDLKGLKLSGNIGEVVTNLSSLRDTIKSIITEINRVVKIAGEDGQLSERLKIDGFEGSWKSLCASLNQLLVNISDPVLEINKIVTAISQGDMTKSFTMNSKGDIKDMGDALNIALQNLNKLMKEIEKSSLTVASSALQMTYKSEGMKKSTTEVSTAIQQMASGAQDQANRTDESSKLVEMILKSANEMGTKADIINNSAERGQESCKNGLRIIRQLVENMLGISGSADITSNSIEVLTNRSEEISRTLSVITDIASQTNLLALNAAIEAARAGDAGRGFAVVAEEIRKLAEDSRKSAVDIDKVVKDVQKDVLSANKAIEKMKTSVDVGSKASLEAENVFNEINTSSSETLSLSKEIQESTNGQKTSISTVVKNIEKIVVVSEEVAAGTQEVASSSIELNKSMEEISRTSENLSKVAEELKKGVDQFKLTA